MILSRKWLNEFVDVSDISDREFDEAMTLSGSKVETVTALDESLKNVVVGKILSMEKHPDSDHMWICQIDVGQAEPTQIVTGAWNIHVGDLVPVAQHKSLLPGGVKIEKGKLRGVESNGMLCSLKELNLTAEHDYPYAVITPAALLNDYKPLDPEKPSIPADIKAGDKVFGPVVCGKVLECEAQSYGVYHTTLDIGSATVSPDTACSNLHAGDLVAYNTKTDSICTLSDLHAEQAEFPHCIPDGIFVLREDVAPGEDIAKVIGADDHVVEFEITPNRPDCLSVIGLAREASATFGRPLKLHTPEVKGCGGSIAELVDIDIEDGDLCPRYTARMVKNVKIQPSPAWMRERLRNSGVRPINNIVDITKFMDECKAMGIQVLGPDVNESILKFSVDKDKNIRFGLGAIKGVGESAVMNIIEERKKNGPYTNIFDFVERVNLTACNKKNIESLALAGAFDDMGIQREQFFADNGKGEQFLEVLVRYGNKYQTDKSTAVNSLFGGDAFVAIAKPEIPQCERWGDLEKLNKEKELVGIYLSAHPLDEYRIILTYVCNTGMVEINDRESLRNRDLLLGGIVTAFREGTTKNGKPYGIVKIENISYAVIDVDEKEMVLQKCNIKNNEIVLFVKTYLKTDKNDKIINYINFEKGNIHRNYKAEQE